MQAVFRDRNEPTAEASFAAIFERSKLGMAIAAMIKMIATTIRSSISENPFCFLSMTSSPLIYTSCAGTQSEGAQRARRKEGGGGSLGIRSLPRNQQNFYLMGGSVTVGLEAVVLARITPD